ncbi:hypothetical protein GGTG_07522 [Gaeumannomyces tritici R3-111a-1]|uniref:Uncharacterized protein n=1 Tax=Gaeumannomyces tritici (strain R3-111a-1) TaxID=644352 RepID=J3P1X4_GAET3|nr:hypothetical protein GGTG_07522 [Gaeumannomyces tritici R3-111a-1]EJT73666.1 hypothetical protein GGTG_07522 [Gaeumannomyces tritici R3-111a-1]
MAPRQFSWVELVLCLAAPNLSTDANPFPHLSIVPSLTTKSTSRKAGLLR